jgi:hypothetical protein
MEEIIQIQINRLEVLKEIEKRGDKWIEDYFMDVIDSIKNDEEKTLVFSLYPDSLRLQ